MYYKCFFGAGRRHYSRAVFDKQYVIQVNQLVMDNVCFWHGKLYVPDKWTSFSFEVCQHTCFVTPIAIIVCTVVYLNTHLFHSSNLCNRQRIHTSSFWLCQYTSLHCDRDYLHTRL